MKTKAFKVVAGSMFMLFNSGLSYAQPAQNDSRNQRPPSVEEIFNRMDKDEDGKLSKKEIKGPLKDSFAEIDSNEDGFLTEEEVLKAPKPKGPKPSERSK